MIASRTLTLHADGEWFNLDAKDVAYIKTLAGGGS